MPSSFIVIVIMDAIRVNRSLSTFARWNLLALSLTIQWSHSQHMRDCARLEGLRLAAGPSFGPPTFQTARVVYRAENCIGLRKT